MVVHLDDHKIDSKNPQEDPVAADTFTATPVDINFRCTNKPTRWWPLQLRGKRDIKRDMLGGAGPCVKLSTAIPRSFRPFNRSMCLRLIHAFSGALQLHFCLPAFATCLRCQRPPTDEPTGHEDYEGMWRNLGKAAEAWRDPLVAFFIKGAIWHGFDSAALQKGAALRRTDYIRKASSPVEAQQMVL
ncbi:MAG: hypothetical protein M1835_006939 [Candelina submexicana]|nr:MAG: hypothetical protein M1835_006939 [Candelina submexicana]